MVGAPYIRGRPPTAYRDQVRTATNYVPPHGDREPGARPSPGDRPPSTPGSRRPGRSPGAVRAGGGRRRRGWTRTPRCRPPRPADHGSWPRGRGGCPRGRVATPVRCARRRGRRGSVRRARAGRSTGCRRGGLRHCAAEYASSATTRSSPSRTRSSNVSMPTGRGALTASPPDARRAPGAAPAPCGCSGGSGAAAGSTRGRRSRAPRWTR